ncbi:hypothetical protein EW026_g3561 [Hermanssonia centrifuga]|uniref:AB hydrolase-1 domain-containing protein n=1 Tax=Hermanssonia centrifuga TaxID=98765 RepID=A0A4S4KKU8_9APHY|nr:hypothetical protein EW026_g3561 [Hermanssonia centrifuga]
MLGYGGTDKPTDPSLYLSSGISSDFVDILDAEKVGLAVAIGHDWGARAISALAQYHPERIAAYAFFVLPYIAPGFIPAVDFKETLAATKKLLGFELFGYWLFFSEEDANDIIQKHIDSFISIIYTHDTEIWKTHVSPTGTFKAALLEDYTSPLASYITEEDKEVFRKTFAQNGFAAPTCWYKVMTTLQQPKEDEKRTYPPSSAPIFFAGARKDAICLPENGYRTFAEEGFKDHKITTHEYDADHWLYLSHADEINADLGTWLKSIVP